MSKARAIIEWIGMFLFTLLVYSSLAWGCGFMSVGLVLWAVNHLTHGRG